VGIFELMNGDFMKIIIIGLTLLSSAAAFAGNRDLIMKCVQDLNAHAAPACTGVKSESDVKMVLKCVKDLNAYAAPACEGVKSESDVLAVLDCVKDLNAYASPSCKGVFNP
jgi:hypothetical protein